MPHRREHQRHSQREPERNAPSEEHESEDPRARAEEERWFRREPYEPWREGWSARIGVRTDERSERLYGRPDERWRQSSPYAREPGLREHGREGTFAHREPPYDWRTSAEQDDFARHGNPYADPRRFGASYLDDQHAEPRWSPTRERFHRGPWDPPAYQGAYDQERYERDRYGGQARGGAEPWYGDFAPAAKGRGPTRGPKGYKRSDDRIREDVCDQLAHASELDSSDVEVSVSQGEVTLTGSVPQRYMKYEIEEICDHTGGVNEIHNMLRVRRPGVSGTEPHASREARHADPPYTQRDEPYSERDAPYSERTSEARDERSRDDLRRHHHS